MKNNLDSESYADGFSRRLAGAIEWCTGRSIAVPVGDRLWTPALRPPELAERPLYVDILPMFRLPVGDRGPYLEPISTIDRLSHSARRDLVGQVVTERERLLGWQDSHQPHPLDLAGGRLLAFDPDLTLTDCAAERATNGFFDWYNLPAWDTWVSYEVDEAKLEQRDARFQSGDHSWDGVEFVGAILSWIPPDLLDLVDDGIQYNNEGCIQWVDELDISFSQVMRRLGLF